MIDSKQTYNQLCGAAEARRAHNPEVTRSKRVKAKLEENIIVVYFCWVPRRSGTVFFALQGYMEQKSGFTTATYTSTVGLIEYCNRITRKTSHLTAALK